MIGCLASHPSRQVDPQSAGTGKLHRRVELGKGSEKSKRSMQNAVRGNWKQSYEE